MLPEDIARFLGRVLIDQPHPGVTGSCCRQAQKGVSHASFLLESIHHGHYAEKGRPGAGAACGEGRMKRHASLIGSQIAGRSSCNGDRDNRVRM
jgi:hypothetical protein